MGRGPYAKGVAKRRELIEIATVAVIELGYRHVSLREIARRADMSQTGLVHYFPTKEALYVDVLRHRDELGYAAEIDHDILGHLFVGFVEALDTPGLVHLYAALAAEAVEPEHPAHPFFMERFEHLVGRITGGLEKLRAEGGIAPSIDCMAVARLLVAAMDGLQVQWLVNPSVDAGHLLAYLWDLVLTASPPAPSDSVLPASIP